MRDFYYTDEGGILCFPDGRVMTPSDAAEKINKLVTDITALRHDLEVSEHERDEARKELEEWRRAHSQPICNPPEATGEYVDVLGEEISSDY